MAPAMDPLLALKALVMGIVEGLTEFLPISSTGHLILAGDLLGSRTTTSRRCSTSSIQTGAMLAVCWEYRARFLGVLAGSHAAGRAALRAEPRACLPARRTCSAWCSASAIKRHLFHPVPVALAFIVGGVHHSVGGAAQPQACASRACDDMTWRDALKVGLAQCFALIPGTSRSGATIIGGMLFGLSRQAATEFSFFLAVPTLIGAGAYDLVQATGACSARRPRPVRRRLRRVVRLARSSACAG